MLQKLIDAGLYKVGTPLKLHLGCGQQYLKGYINVDFPSDQHNVMTVSADAYADITKLSFPENSVDEIKLSHVFEHFDRVTALVLLVRWQSWLKIDGVLHIETPDVLESAKQLASNITYEQKMAIIRHLEGDQSALWGFHVGQYFDERYENMLSQLGYHILTIEKSKWGRWPYLSNITVIAIKLVSIPIENQINKCHILLKDSLVSDKESGTFKIWKQKLLQSLQFSKE
jgi:predicted SAM-dependent methyltransferase